MKSRRHQHLNDDHEEHGDDELWVISYADMMTLLFGFFVILYSFSTVDEHKFNSVSQQLAEAFKTKKDPKVSESDMGVNFEQRQIRALQLMVAMLNLGDNMRDAMATIEQAAVDQAQGKAAKSVAAEKILAHQGDFQKGPDVSEADDRVIDFIIPDTSLFASGSSTLMPQAVLRLQTLAADLKLLPDISEVEVVGHTDGQGSGAGAAIANFTLSSTRAGAVAAVLMRYGVASDKLSVRGMGALKPLVPERTAEGRLLPENSAKNRRVHLVIRRKVHASSLGN